MNFYGVYATNPKAELGTVDFFIWSWRTVTLVSPTIQRERGSLAIMVGGSTKQNFAYQYGSEANGDAHSAGMIVTGLGHALKSFGLKSTIWGWYDYASGDSDPAAGGFHHLFPLAHKYNGFMDLFGRRNLHDFNMQWIIPANPKVNLLVWYHYLMLDRATTPYSVVMTPYNAGNRAVSRDLGHEVDFLLTYARSPREQIQLGYSIFAAGDYFALTREFSRDLMRSSFTRITSGSSNSVQGQLSFHRDSVFDPLCLSNAPAFAGSRDGETSLPRFLAFEFRVEQVKEAWRHLAVISENAHGWDLYLREPLMSQSFARASRLPRILIIDDDPLIERLVLSCIGPNSFDIYQVATAQNGLQQIEDWRPDLVLLDQVLPDRAGIDVIPEIAGIDRQLPILFITASSSSQTAIEAARRGAFDFSSNLSP